MVAEHVFAGPFSLLVLLVLMLESTVPSSPMSAWDAFHLSSWPEFECPLIRSP